MRSETTDFVLAIDFGGTKLDVATATLDGEIVLSQRLDTDASAGAEQAVDRAIALARALIATTASQLGDPSASLRAAGATSPGIVLDDRILLAPNVPGWEDLALGARLSEGLGIDVVTETDVKAATRAEATWGALVDADPGIFLNLGTGLAVGITIDGTVLRGANGAAGEIGYALRSPEDQHGVNTGHAPLEEHVGGRAIGERGGATAAEVFTNARHGDDNAKRLVTSALDELAVHVANLALAIDPARIAVGGGLMHHHDLVLPALTKRIEQAVPFPPPVVPARFVHDAALRGAIALAIDHTNMIISRGGAAR
jgi:glucokinase